MRRGVKAIGSALACVALLGACKPVKPAKPPPPPPTAASAPARVARSVYAAKATADGAGTWTYQVSGMADGEPARFDAVRFRTSADLHDCGLAVVGGDPPQEASVSRPGATGLRAEAVQGKAWRSVQLVLSCPHRMGGLVTLVVTDATGALHERIPVGPVVGPAR